MKKIYLLILLNTVILGFSYGQLTVQPANATTNKLQDIVQALVGQGVTVTNITSNLPPTTDAYGTFTEVSDQLGITKGLLMTSGTVQNAVGPNNETATTYAGFLTNDGDSDLETLVSDITHDACVIEFDITTSSTQISFNYIFGSEEYPEYVNSLFNDVFAFFISGPGINGKKNIALLPGGSIPVSIHSVNEFTNASYFVDNGDGVNSGGTIVQYDGYTVKLKAMAQVIPCNTYHLKLAIADVDDWSLDSGVFIEAGSLSGNESLLLGGNIIAPDSVEVCSSEFPISLKAGLNTLAHYDWLKNGTIITSGSNQFYDVNANGWYKVIASQGLNCSWTDSILIEADSEFVLVTSPDTIICAGGSAALSAVPTNNTNLTYTYQWTPATGLSAVDIYNPVSTPANTITYTVMVDGGKCAHTTQIQVKIMDSIKLQVNSNFDGCVNKPIQLIASGAPNYIWSPGTYLNDPGIANPIATLPSNAVYNFKVKSSNQCYSDSANLTVSVYEFPPVNAYGDTALCYGGIAQLSSDYFGQYQYSWSPSGTLSNDQIYNPVALPKTSKNYVLTINNHGCIKKDTVHVIVKEQVVAKIVLPVTEGQIPWTVQFGNGSTGASSYTWDLSGFGNTHVPEPTFTITKENYYSVVLKAMNSIGCFDYDTLVLKAYHLFIPNLITPNGDNKNDNFEITGLGDQFSLEVCNRWGEMVYKNNSYRNEWTGEGLTDGIYYYLIKDPLYDKQYKGWVQILH